MVSKLWEQHLDEVVDILMDYAELYQCEGCGLEIARFHRKLSRIREVATERINDD